MGVPLEIEARQTRGGDLESAGEKVSKGSTRQPGHYTEEQEEKKNAYRIVRVIGSAVNSNHDHNDAKGASQPIQDVPQPLSHIASNRFAECDKRKLGM